MTDFFWQFYFPETELKSGSLLNCIELIEKLNLSPKLEHALSGPDTDLDKRQNETRSYIVDNRLNWIGNKINSERSITLNSDFDCKDVSGWLIVSTAFIKYRIQSSDTFVFNLITKNTSYEEHSLFEAVSRIASGLKIYWGIISPHKMKTIIGKQIVRPHEKNRKPTYDLPIVKVPQFLSGPEVPFFFGWTNYWSKATAELIGFDQSKDAELFYKIQSTDNGGFILQLTEEPLDLEIPAHVEILKKAYDRFPKVGGRDTPFDYLK